MPSRVISIRISESEIVNLNLLLGRLGYSSVGDLVKAIASGKYLVNQNLISEIAQSVQQLFTNSYIVAVSKREQDECDSSARVRASGVPPSRLYRSSA
jgi:hypothetical protein